MADILKRMNGNASVEKQRWMATQCSDENKSCVSFKSKGTPLIHFGQHVHIMCKSCGFHSHSNSLQNYYMHISTPEGIVS